MKKILIILIPLILLFAGCTEEENNGATGKAIAVKKALEYNYPVEVKDYINGMGQGKFVLTSNELAFIQTGEKISVEVDKRGIPQYAFGYELIFSKPLNIGESIDSFWFHEKATITFSNSNTVLVEVGGKTIQLKNFNTFKEITKEKYNTEFLKKDEKLIGLKIYNTQPITTGNVTSLYNA